MLKLLKSIVVLIKVILHLLKIIFFFVLFVILNKFFTGVKDLIFNQEQPIHKTMLTKNQIDSALTAYEHIGLFNHLTLNQIKELRIKAYEKEYKSYNSLLMIVPNLIITFDSELDNLENPYASLIKRFGEHSHETFTPTDISDDFNIDNKEVTLNFKFNDKQYKEIFPINEDWISDKFFILLDTIASENQLEGHFYHLPSDGQDIIMIYLTTSQYEYLRSNKLLFFTDQWEKYMLENE